MLHNIKIASIIENFYVLKHHYIFVVLAKSILFSRSGVLLLLFPFFVSLVIFQSHAWESI